MQIPGLDSPLFVWVVLPILIFLARICDVSIGTIRILFISRGNKVLAPILGFFEVLIWLLAIGQIMKNLNNVLCYMAYAAGFASGNLIGMRIEEKLALGKIIVRIITQNDATSLVGKLRQKGFGATNVVADGSRGPVNLIFSIIDRTNLPNMVQLIHEFNPKSFYTIEDVRLVKEGIFPGKNSTLGRFGLKSKPFPWQFKFMKNITFSRKGK